MTELSWLCKTFDKLNNNELYAIMQLRADVFVLEQNCLYRDLDDKDQKSLHLMGFDPVSQELLAYSRILPAGLSYDEVSIGRVLTSPRCRGLQIGRQLFRRSIDLALANYPGQPIRIGAQAHLQQFYGSFGFVGEGEIYDEDGIDHIEMILKP